jgi:hypothetical protein
VGFRVCEGVNGKAGDVVQITMLGTGALEVQRSERLGPAGEQGHRHGDGCQVNSMCGFEVTRNDDRSARGRQGQ